MDLGVHVASFSWPEGDEGIAGQFAEIAQAVDQGGFYSLSVMDHLFQMDQWAPASEPMLEGYTALGYLAAVTEHTHLLSHVYVLPYRHPLVAAKAWATLDAASKGRACRGERCSTA